MKNYTTFLFLITAVFTLKTQPCFSASIEDHTSRGNHKKILPVSGSVADDDHPAKPPVFENQQHDTISYDTIICGQNVPFVWKGKNCLVSGTYIEKQNSATGYDTAFILNLTVLPVDTLFIDKIICGLEAPFELNGATYHETGVYFDTIKSVMGCDTVVQLELTVLPADTLMLDTTICGLDAPFELNGATYHETGVYFDIINSVMGCDTVVQLELTVLPADTLMLDTTICSLDAPFKVHGFSYSRSGWYVDKIVSSSGCDTIFILDLTVLPVDTFLFDTTICCSDEPFIWYGQSIYETGTFIDTLISISGCNSIVILNLTVLAKADTLANSADIKLTNEFDFLNVYPNPTRDFLMVELLHHDESCVLIDIYDITGRKIYGKRTENYSLPEKIEMGGFPDGIYLLSVKTRNNSAKIKILKG